jgi:hypothetical protein
LDKFRKFQEKKQAKTLAAAARNAAVATRTFDKRFDEEFMEPFKQEFVSTDFLDDYRDSLRMKMTSVDRKVLPEQLSYELCEEIHNKRADAFKAAEQLSSREVFHEMKNISGMNFSIPDDFVVFDEDQKDINLKIRACSMGANFLSERVSPFEAAVSAGNYAEGNIKFSEPLQKGFCNPTFSLVSGNYKMSDDDYLAYFRNYLEVARLSNNTWKAWVDLASRSDRSVITVINRALPLKTLASVGKHIRPFPVEVAGITYYCDPVFAARAYKHFKKVPIKAVFACAISELKPFIHQDDIINLVDVFDMESEDPIEEELRIDKGDDIKPEWLDYLIENCSKVSLERLYFRGGISKSKYDTLLKYKECGFRFPSPYSILSQANVEMRNELVSQERENQIKIAVDVKAHLAKYNTTLLPLVEELLVRSRRSSSSSSSMMGIMGDFESESEVSSESEEDFALNMFDESEAFVDTTIDIEEEIAQANVQFDPKFISEVRLWPNVRKLFDNG